jgi:type I restriction enzyme S subunit
MTSELSSLCSYAKGKVSVDTLSKRNYVSTENMVPNKGGIVDAGALPSAQYTQQYMKDDILVSNIRPYFKKIWMADDDGGCSNDVLVFRAECGCDSTFLYYVLANDAFFNYASATSKGTKMPRGDKTAIMQYEVPCFNHETQLRIGKLLRSIDDRITVNKKINDNLQQQAFSVFDNLIANAENNDCTVSDYAFLNPKRTLAKNQVSRSIDMSQLSTSGAFPSGWEMKPFNGGMRFTNGDTLLARITPCLENGKTAFIDFLDDGEVAFGSTEYIVLAPKNDTPPEMLYCLARYPAFVDYAVKNMNGSSGRQRVSAETVGQYRLPLFDKHSLVLFKEVVSPMFLKMRYNSLENMRLAELRDALLPKLMSSEINVSAVQL